MSTDMTLRDWFAGQALSGWLASCPDEQGVIDPSGLSAFAYRVADAMMRERAK
jgi:hypothetical protein